MRGEFTRITGLGAILCRHFEKSRFYRPKVRIANRQISRGSSAQRPGYRPTHVLHATVPSGSGPARKHTAKFEPAAWSWAQMTSGSGAPKRVLSEEAITFKRQRPNWVSNKITEPSSENPPHSILTTPKVLSVNTIPLVSAPPTHLEYKP